MTPRAVIEKKAVAMLRKHAREEPIPSTAIAERLGLSAFERNSLWQVLDRLARAGKIRRAEGPHKKCTYWLWQGGRAQVAAKPPEYVRVRRDDLEAYLHRGSGDVLREVHALRRLLEAIGEQP